MVKWKYTASHNKIKVQIDFSLLFLQSFRNSLYGSFFPTPDNVHKRNHGCGDDRCLGQNQEGRRSHWKTKIWHLAQYSKICCRMNWFSALHFLVHCGYLVICSPGHSSQSLMSSLADGPTEVDSGQPVFKLRHWSSQLPRQTHVLCLST